MATTPTLDALLAAIAAVTSTRPLPGPRLGRYAVPIFEVRSGQSADAAAAEYLQWLLSIFSGDARAALAAYAEGPGIRATWCQLRDWSALWLVLDRETVEFVEAVMAEVERRGRRAV